MAYDTNNPFAEQPPLNWSPNPSAERQADLAGQWRTALENPNNRAALMQFGIALMQPVSLGQTPAGHFGQAVGSAGEAVGRRVEQERRDEETESRSTLREAQAQAQEARAGTAAARMGLESERLRLTREAAQGRTAVQARRAWAGEVDAIRKQNANALLDPKAPKVPEPTWEQWLAKNPTVARMIEAEQGLAVPGTMPTAAPAADEAVSEAPRDPAQRTVGTVYQTPRGALRWTGKGWEPL